MPQNDIAAAVYARGIRKLLAEARECQAQADNHLALPCAGCARSAVEPPDECCRATGTNSTAVRTQSASAQQRMPPATDWRSGAKRGTQTGQRRQTGRQPCSPCSATPGDPIRGRLPPSCNVASVRVSKARRSLELKTLGFHAGESNACCRRTDRPIVSRTTWHAWTNVWQT